MRVDQALFIVQQEYQNAEKRHKPMLTYHEGYAVILEELDELWDEVKKRPSQRDVDKLRVEAKQVATMAIRFLIDLVPAEFDKPISEILKERHAAGLWPDGTSAQSCGCDPGADWKCEQHRG